MRVKVEWVERNETHHFASSSCMMSPGGLKEAAWRQNKGVPPLFRFDTPTLAFL